MEIARYGTASGLRLRSDDRTGAFAWDSDADPARRRLRITTDCCPATAAVRTSPSAPSHPQNERRLVAQLIACLGRRIASGLYTPVPLSDLLPPARGAKFLSQRLDLLLAFSNGCCPVLEPGDHTKGDAPVAQHRRSPPRGGRDLQRYRLWQRHRHALYHTQPGDIVVVDARGDLSSGVFGEMMLTYFRGRGGLAAVVDGCIRDFPKAKELGLGLWLRGTTPNYHTQTNIFPFAVNVPIACGGVLVMPGDIIIADDDGAVVVPSGLAPQLLQAASAHAEWEDFSRMRLAEGGDLRKYYPLSDEARAEYEAWRRTQRPRPHQQ